MTVSPNGHNPLLPDDLRPWDQQPGEGTKHFHAFCHYRDLPVHERSIDKAWRVHAEKCQGKTVPRFKRAPHIWPDWSSRWGWVERVSAWEREVDRQAREKILKDQTDARARHARMAQATMSALSVPSRAVLEALQDPKVLPNIVEMARKTPKSFIKLIDLVSWASRGLPGLVQVERLALGLSTEQIEVDDLRADATGLTIPNDPESTALALELLGRLSAQQAPLAALGDDEEEKAKAAQAQGPVGEE